MEHILVFLISLLTTLLTTLPVLVEGQGRTCTADTIPVLKMCYENQAAATTIMMDFSAAEDQLAESCSCQVQIIQGTTLAISELFGYDSPYCGTEFQFKDRIFKCFGSSNVEVNSGDVLPLNFTKVQYEKASDYCYSLTISGDSPDPLMSVICSAPFVNTTTSSTTSTSSSTTTSTTTTTSTPEPPTTQPNTTTERTNTTTQQPTTVTKPSTTTTSTTTTKSPTTSSEQTITSKSSQITNTTSTTTTTTAEQTTTLISQTTNQSEATTKAVVRTSESSTQSTVSSSSTEKYTKKTTPTNGKVGMKIDDNIPWMIVVPIIGVGFFIIITLIIVACLLCRRKQKNQDDKEKYDQPYIAHDNQGMVPDDPDKQPVNGSSTPQTNISPVTTVSETNEINDENKKELNEMTNDAEHQNGDVVSESKNDVSELYATPQKKIHKDENGEPEVTNKSEML